ncbi:hypothetical protein CA51_27080 [Rosistilla oblonga]|uniref:hypothetical protein n=1 Tax=Rosistilla oblonga TaxID=2527990 RepID=UPI00118B7AE0|nr:hypothetical protein [Rosistilla oblonga]QDV12822.1 hypothetical protein CA51_27080 [Rosistilla oblonga]
MKAMRVEMSFFDGDEPLARTKVLVHEIEEECEIECSRGDRFAVTRKFEEPACPILIKSFNPNGEFVGRSAMRMGVHNSDDLEAVDLAEPYVLCFRCAIVDCGDPDWATCDPMPD